jgi:hypothetical protein
MTVTDSRRAIRWIGILLIIYAALVATHEGEFWPFSIYPMFSQAGNPWTRAMVVDVTDMPDEQIWQVQPLEDVRHRAVAVRPLGIDQIDYANFMSKTRNWTDSRREALLTMFGDDHLEGRRWMTAKVTGRPAEDDTVVIEVHPWLMLTEEGVIENPHLDSDAYFRGGEP